MQQITMAINLKFTMLFLVIMQPIIFTRCVDDRFIEKPSYEGKNKLLASSGYIYSVSERSLNVHQISVAGSLTLSSNVALTNTVENLFFNRNNLWLTSYGNQTNIYNLTNPALPTLLLTASVTSSFGNIYAEQDSVLYAIPVVQQSNTLLQVYNIKNPSAASIVSSINIGAAAALFIKNNALYIAEKNQIRIMDITNPYAPNQIGFITNGLQNTSISLSSANYIQITSTKAVEWYNATNALMPVFINRITN
jgi:hypothetical protein